MVGPPVAFFLSLPIGSRIHRARIDVAGHTEGGKWTSSEGERMPMLLDRQETVDASVAASEVAEKVRGDVDVHGTWK